MAAPVFWPLDFDAVRFAREEPLPHRLVCVACFQPASLLRFRNLFHNLRALWLRSRVVTQRYRDVTKVSLLAISASLRRGSNATTILSRTTIDERRSHP